MTLGFTESKADSNLCFKVEVGRPVISYYVSMYYFFSHGGVVDYRWNIPSTREVCSRDPENIWDDGLQGYGHTYGIEPKSIECCFIRDG